MEAQSKPGLWPISEITFGGLFGERGLSLPLDPRLTVLTGENGSGKSTLLNAIHAVANENWLYLFKKIPMQSLRLDFEDGAILDVKWTTDGLVIAAQGELWRFDAEQADEFHPEMLTDLRERRSEGVLDRVRHSGMWRGQMRYAFDSDQIAHVIAPPWLGDLADRFSTKLISARRLEHRLRPDPNAAGEEARVPVVEEFATQLKDLMKTELSAYATESRRQEKILPSKIVQAMQAGFDGESESLSAEVGGLRAEVRSLADSLARVGLFQDEAPDTLPEYPSNDPSILLAVREVYRVTRQRLEQLTKLRTDLQLFSDFLNERLSKKEILLNQQVGISVVLDSGEEIRPSELSSGEQQLLALAFELLFGSKPETVVLLDEPELSLHVAWLEGLLTSFSDMGDSRGLQFLIATHSPTVLKGHQAKERSLDLVKF